MCQLLNTDEKLKDKERALLLLASPPKSYKSLVQTLIIGGMTFKIEHVIVALRECERMMQRESINDRD